MSTTSNVLVKTAVIVVVFCLAECAAGARSPKSSCLKYGHSCWGGHGKRNGGNINGGLRIREESPGHAANTRWYLSRLVQAPSDLRLWREEQDKHNMVARNLQDRRIQNDSETDSDYSKRPAEDPEEMIPDSQPEEENEDVILLEEPPASFGDKLRLYKLMKKNAEKLK